MGFGNIDDRYQNARPLNARLMQKSDTLRNANKETERQKHRAKVKLRKLQAISETVTALVMRS